MWKKIHVELAFENLSSIIYFPNPCSSSLLPLLSSSPCFFFPCSSLLQLVILLRIHVLQRGFRIWYFFFPCSTSSDLCSPKRSLDLVLPSFLVHHLLLWNSSLKDSSSMWPKTSPCQQSELEYLRLNFFAELEPQRLEMLFSSILSNSC